MLGKIEAIINSMTLEERRKPNIIDGSRKRRIASGSGASTGDVSRLLKQFAKTKQMLKQFKKFGNKPGFPLGKLN
jgi:signal recognition particle subunit SRP54